MPDNRSAYRSIPACAGEPSAMTVRCPALTVYPRVCGGTPPSGPHGSCSGGLSPRVRGNRPAPTRQRPGAGSIPACAGEPPLAGQGRAVRPVYPRVCGGTSDSGHAAASGRGLSPRVRGNPVGALPADRAAGSIPACAGEPSAVRRRLGRRQVYPRVCGGTHIFFMPLGSDRGLSPRVRGNPSRRGAPAHRRWSIPACAGEPPAAVWPGCGQWVYPRVCGGTAHSESDTRCGQGLSPRVRGNPSVVRAVARASGSIPACAGEPADAVVE